MKHLIVASMGSLALGLATADAADLSVPTKAISPPAYVWTGCYLGGHAGTVWAQSNWRVNDPADPFYGQTDVSHIVNGWLSGVQAGCDYQFAGGFVIGISGDYAWSFANGDYPSVLFPNFVNHSEVKSLASVTGRIGYAWNRFLGYVKGGAAWEQAQYTFTDGSNLGSASDSRNGWTIGVGGEYALSDAISGFIEYNYYAFGKKDLNFQQSGPNVIAPTFIYNIDATKSVLKVGLNYRFSMGR